LRLTGPKGGDSRVEVVRLLSTSDTFDSLIEWATQSKNHIN